MSDKHDTSETPDTGHVWDDNLRELANPPPRWWMIAFHISWIFVVIYALLYPTIPLINGHTKGLLGWTSIKEYKEGVAQLDAVRGPFEAQLAELSSTEILADRELTNYTLASAKVLFGERCGACHGSGGQGNPGFPVLADDDWLYGGKIETIEASIRNGRQAMMPSHTARLTPAEVADLTTYVSGLADGKDHEPGRVIYTGKAVCFACHGMDGKGNRAMGAVDLTDHIWRFSGTPEAIAYTISHGVNDPSDPQTRTAKMPAFGSVLTDTEVKKLAVFVHRLGGGE